MPEKTYPPNVDDFGNAFLITQRSAQYSMVEYRERIRTFVSSEGISFEKGVCGKLRGKVSSSQIFTKMPLGPSSSAIHVQNLFYGANTSAPYVPDDLSLFVSVLTIDFPDERRQM
jgi:hypothetical protein